MLAMRRLGPAALALAFVLVAPGLGSADVVARGVHDGSRALDAKGTPSVAYMRGKSLIVATRTASGRWRAEVADSVSPGSQVMAFEVGAVGPVVLTLSGDNRRLTLVRRRFVGWQSIQLNGRLGPNGLLGWPGLALDRGGLPVVAYTRWNSASFKSQLLPPRLGAGHARDARQDQRLQVRPRPGADDGARLAQIGGRGGRERVDEPGRPRTFGPEVPLGGNDRPQAKPCRAGWVAGGAGGRVS